MITIARVYHKLRACGWSASAAFSTAKSYVEAKRRSDEYDLCVSWDHDDLPWDDECEAPEIVALATVFHPDYERKGRSAERFPFADGGCPSGYVQSTRPGTSRFRGVLASLGGIGLASWSDPYMLEVESELLNEACDELEAERDRAAQAEADELAARATYAHVC